MICSGQLFRRLISMCRHTTLKHALSCLHFPCHCPVVYECNLDHLQSGLQWGIAFEWAIGMGFGFLKLSVWSHNNEVYSQMMEMFSYLLFLIRFKWLGSSCRVSSNVHQVALMPNTEWPEPSLQETPAEAQEVWGGDFAVVAALTGVSLRWGSGHVQFARLSFERWGILDCFFFLVTYGLWFKARLEE